MRKTSWLLLGTVALSAGIYEGVFLSSAPSPFTYFRPILPICVLLFLLDRRPAVYFMVLISGGIIDLMSVPSSSLVMMRWLCVLLVVDLLAEKVATNRSLYASMFLIGTARLLDRLLGLVMSWPAGILLHHDVALGSWTVFFGTITVDLALMALAFVVLSVFTKRFVVAVDPRHTRYG